MKFKHLLCCLFAILLTLTGAVAAQQPAKPKRPVKNPPQFPNIIDLENKDGAPAAQPAETAPAEAAKPAQQPPADALTQALVSLIGEMRSLTRELKALNLRNQAQLDTLKLTRLDMRVDHYERELRPVRDRLALLTAEEQNLLQLMTRDSLLAQTAQAATFNRDELMRQIRLQHEARLRAVQAEKERLQKLEADLTQSLGIYQKLGGDTERRIQETEEALREKPGGSKQ